MKSENIPSTARSARFHVNLFGFDSVEAFARSLPKNAKVADIGAGISNFGYEVCKIRKDVKWTNIDPCYSSNKIQNCLPPKLSNLKNKAIDITIPNQSKKLNGTYDLVYSYWLLPHLSASSEELARTAIDNMIRLTKTDGTLAVGPKKMRGLGLFSPIRYKGLVMTQERNLDNKLTDEIYKQTRLWWLPRIIQNYSNKYGIHLGMYFVGGKAK